MLWGGAVVAVLLFGVSLYWFQPWKLVTSKTVNDAVPVVAPSETGGASRSGSAASVSPGAGSAAASARLVAQGKLITHEHATSGTAELVRLPSGRHRLILRELSTSDGPDLRVWLTDQEVLRGSEGWKVFDDGRYVEVGRLKGNQGTQVYDVPQDVDVADYRSVSIWCKRFSVSFGAATLA